MSLEDLGYNNKLEKFRTYNHLRSFEAGRVIAEIRSGILSRQIKENLKLRLLAICVLLLKVVRFPCCGDWVALTILILILL